MDKISGLLFLYLVITAVGSAICHVLKARKSFITFMVLLVLGCLAAVIMFIYLFTYGMN